MSYVNTATFPAASSAQEAATLVPVAIAAGDGIGPEIMDATLRILDAAQARLSYNPLILGEAVYRQGFSSGIAPESWEVLRQTGILLKGPITTPQGGGVKSINVTLRKTLGLFANVRPCVAYSPFIPVPHAAMNVVIIRENEEDLYAGIEHRQTDDVYQCLKLITRPGCERIVRYAFEYARKRGRRKVTCFTKDNIMKLTDGLFHKVFDEIAAEYPDIENEHLIVDIGMARLASAPHLFDVIVTPNLYGDIVSDIAAEISGSVGLAPSANIGDRFAMFEAIHGSAPSIAGKNAANPSGLLLSAVKMLAHVGQGDTATLIHNAWLTTIEDGIHTQDIYRTSSSTALVGTQEFATAVIDRLGQTPQQLNSASYASVGIGHIPITPRKSAEKVLKGVDVFVHWGGSSPEVLASQLQAVCTPNISLTMVTNRGVKVWPSGFPETFLTDHWRCRFEAPAGRSTTPHEVVMLLHALNCSGVDFIKTEHLYNFDGVPGYSLGQGQ